MLMNAHTGVAVLTGLTARRLYLGGLVAAVAATVGKKARTLRFAGVWAALVVSSTVLAVVLDRFIEPLQSMMVWVALMLSGYFFARRRELEIHYRRQLEFLAEIGPLANPRFGPERTWRIVLDRLAAFYQARACVFVSGNSGSDAVRIRRSGHTGVESIAVSELVPRLAAIGVESGSKDWITVHVGDDEGDHQYLFLHAQRSRFRAADPEFVRQVFLRLQPVLESIRLVDALTRAAAERQRSHVAEDIHDLVLQPLIGVDLALCAMQRGPCRGCNHCGEMERMNALVRDAIGNLRGSVERIHDGDDEAESDLTQMLTSLAKRFTSLTGLDVEVGGDGAVMTSTHLAAEAVKMIYEALSNVRKHSEARRARIEVSARAGTLLMEATNESSGAAMNFLPRSIAERATALGGETRVRREGASTVISISIPL